MRHLFFIPFFVIVAFVVVMVLVQRSRETREQADGNRNRLEELERRVAELEGRTAERSEERPQLP